MINIEDIINGGREYLIDILASPVDSDIEISVDGSIAIVYGLESGKISGITAYVYFDMLNDNRVNLIVARLPRFSILERLLNKFAKDNKEFKEYDISFTYFKDKTIMSYTHKSI